MQPMNHPAYNLKPNTRIENSLSCRRWYDSRREARQLGIDPPIWAHTSPPWPVIRLAAKQSGKPVALGAMFWCLGLLAASGDEQYDSETIDHSLDMPAGNDDMYRRYAAVFASWLGLSQGVRAE